MYSQDGNGSFIVEAHIALWDARPENQCSIHGKQVIDCFYDYHKNLSPAEADETETGPRGADETPAAHDQLVTA